MMLSRGAWQKPARLSEGFSEKQEGHHDGGLPRQDSGRHGSGISGKKRRPKEGGESCTEC